MNAAVIITVAALLATKWLDCRTTLRRIDSPAGETNPLARTAMARWGMRRATWGVFALAALITGTAAAAALGSPSPWARPAFTALGLAIAAVQGAVARHNATGRSNAVTRAVLRAHCAWLRGRTDHDRPNRQFKRRSHER